MPGTGLSPYIAARLPHWTANHSPDKSKRDHEAGSQEEGDFQKDSEGKMNASKANVTYLFPCLSAAAQRW